MYKTDEFIEKRILWKAKSHNLPSQYSFLYDELNIGLKEYYSKKLEKHIIGKLVLLFLDTEGNWTMLGTKMVASGNEESLNAIKYSSIKNSRPLALVNIKNRKLSSVRKSEWSELLVLDEDENEYILRTNKGADFFAMMSTLLMLQRLRQ